MDPRPVRSALLGLALMGAALAIAPAPALGQIPVPKVPELNLRSGLIDRFLPPINGNLPQDCQRDIFYDTRWANNPKIRPFVNCYIHNGIYGLYWPGECTECNYPNFRGSPGKSTITPDCKIHTPASRWVQNFVHPFKPVGMYYQNGCYSPIYDLDPLVAGPGPFPWPLFLNWRKGH
jgi:hypothetical protein